MEEGPTPGAQAPFSWLAERPKAEALGYLEATAATGAIIAPGACDVIGREDDRTVRGFVASAGGLVPDVGVRARLRVAAELVEGGMSLRSRSGGKGPVRVRPSWVREAFLKVMRVPSGLVHWSVFSVMSPARVSASRSVSKILRSATEGVRRALAGGWERVVEGGRGGLGGGGLMREKDG